ncbi:MAG TPA: nuclear transport factor 2 family protein [Galbitalea sp.]|jgi:hypothetical protein|nr:nuclear transport factor 2 family protein [Galbitalea sp.]
MDMDVDVQDIERLLTDFAWFADRGDGSSLSDLFLPGAVLKVGESRLEGRRAIADDCYARAREPGRKTRHVWSNLRLESLVNGVLRTNAIQQTIETNDISGLTSMRVNDIIDTFERDSESRWRIASRHIDRQMLTNWRTAE